MKRLLRRIALTLVVAWLPLNAVAAAALPACAGHLGGDAAATSHAGDHRHHDGGDRHHGHAPADEAPAPVATYCGLCGLCHQSGQVHALSAFVAAPIVPTGWHMPALSSLPPGFVPDLLRRPPRA